MSLIVSPKVKDILSYESEVWTSADVLRSSVGLKNSEFPDFMMPFFALRMVESRLIREYNQVSQDKSLTTEEDRIEEIKDFVGFYNAVVIEKKKTLAEIVKNDKTFYTDFIEYLNSFDLELKQLLGIVEGDKTENLNISAVIESLRKKNALFGYATAWAKIDFTPYDNSEITTLEEHIKRKWADMSAETAGEQYTPDDIINLISELIVTDDFKTGYPYKIYDMTCGGGNMLFGVEDRIKQLNNAIKTETYGQELRGSLYALSKIESMFRKGSQIEHGNTLTNDKFSSKQFDYGVANPPYGVSWKEEQKTIENDQTGRFGQGGYPGVSDAQLLFVQHMIAKLNETGKAFIVLNGSPLFSGDAGSGESNIRKWILDNDYLEALIQLPTNEFFNTGITTYIWCLNKNKKEARKNQILCINAEDSHVKLKKNKGNKSKEISKEQAKEISNVYKLFEVTNFSKVLSKYYFYFNKQSLKKLEMDNEFGSVELSKVLFKDIEEIKIISNDENINYHLLNLHNYYESLEILNCEDSLNPELIKIINNLIKNSNSIEDLHINIKVRNGIYEYNNNCISFSNNLGKKILGKGMFNFKIIQKNKKAKPANIVNGINDYFGNFIEYILIEPIWIKDDEKIQYLPEPEKNKKLIKDFMSQWVSKNEHQYELLENKIGVEINFNNIFSKKIEIRSTKNILSDIENIDKQLGDI